MQPFSLFVYSCSLAISVASAGDCGEQLDEILARHEAGLEQVQVFELELKIYSPDPPTKETFSTWTKGDGPEPQLYFEGLWASNGVAERIQLTPKRRTVGKNGLPANYDDYLRDGEREFWLANWDWNDPQEISPAKQGSVMAEVRPQTSEFRTRDPAWWLLRTPRFETPEPRLPLRDFIARFASVSCDIGNDPNRPVTITLQDDALELTPEDAEVRVTLDPARDYQIVRLERESTGDAPMMMSYVVDEFLETPSGAVFPQKVVYRVTEAQLPRGVTMGIYEVVESRFDGPVDPSLFEFVFPKDVQVVNSTGDGGEERKWTLWGEDNQPLATIEDPVDLLEYDPVAKAAMPAPRTSFLNWALLANGLIAILAVAWLVCRR